MTFDADRSFETENGFIISNNAGTFSGAGVPTDIAPEGSIYLDTSNDRVYKRVENKWISQWILPKDFISSDEVYTIEESRHHTVMHTMKIDGELIINSVLGVI